MCNTKLLGKIGVQGCLNGSTRLTVDNVVYLLCMCLARWEFRVVKKGVLGLWLITVDIYYEFAWRGKSLGSFEREFSA
jgi:hypothetical protein